MRQFTGFGQCADRAMPACMVRIVSSRPAFASVALPTARPMHDGLVWACHPALVHVEFNRVRSCACCFRYRAGLRQNLLQFRSRVPSPRQQWKPINFLDLPHHCECGFYRQRVRFDEVCLHQPIFLCTRGPCPNRWQALLASCSPFHVESHSMPLR